MDCIIEGTKQNGSVWLGNLESAKNKAELQRRGIGAILTVMSDKEVNY